MPDPRNAPGVDDVYSSKQKSIADLFNDLPYRHYPPKHMILYQGDKIERVYYIISGYVRMYNITPKGNERTLIILGPGESLPLIQSEIATYFYDALTEVEAAYGSYEQIVERFLQDSDYMEVARQAGVQLMQRMVEQMDVLSNDTAQDKVELALRFLAKYYGEENDGWTTIKFRLTHQELGNLVNLTRETVSHLIQKLEKKNVVRTNKGGYVAVRAEGEGQTSPVKESQKKLRDKLKSSLMAGAVSEPSGT